MIEGGAFDQIRDPEMITALTGATMINKGGRHKISFDVLNPVEYGKFG